MTQLQLLGPENLFGLIPFHAREMLMRETIWAQTKRASHIHGLA
jgi:hypothetical protein